MIGTKGIYGCMALIELGSCYKNEAVSIKQLAKKLALSDRYLENIFVSMKNAGWVKGSRGPGGGYRLNPETLKISVLEMIKILEGDIVFGVQLPERTQEQLSYKCFAGMVLNPVKEAIIEYMNETTLEQLIEQRIQLNQGELMYYI